MKTMQRRVARFVRKNRLETDPAHRLLDAVSELGEVAKEVLKGSHYGSARFKRTPGFEAELGDVFFSLLCVANSTGVDAEAAVSKVLEKYQQRIAASGTPASGRRKKAAT